MLVFVLIKYEPTACLKLFRKSDVMVRPGGKYAQLKVRITLLLREVNGRVGLSYCSKPWSDFYQRVVFYEYWIPFYFVRASIIVAVIFEKTTYIYIYRGQFFLLLLWRTSRLMWVILVNFYLISRNERLIYFLKPLCATMLQMLLLSIAHRPIGFRIFYISFAFSVICNRFWCWVMLRACCF